MGDALIANPPLCLAGDFGKLADGRQVQCDLQTALAVKMCYVALSDVLTSVQMVEHFERLFIVAVGHDMEGSHSFASSAMGHLNHSSWTTPGDAALASVVAATGTHGAAETRATGSSKAAADAEEKSKLEKMKEHYERQLQENKAARVRAEEKLGQLERNRRNGSEYGDDRRRFRFNERGDGERNRHGDGDRSTRD